MESPKIPLWLAIIININVIIGAGIFVYSPVVAKHAGLLSTISFLTVALIVLPLVLVVAQVSRLFPGVHGGIYVYSKQLLGKNAGLLSGLSYFLAKSVSIGVLITVFAPYAQDVFPILAGANPKTISLVTLAVLCGLNFLGARFGGAMQLVFVVLKLLPILFAILFTMFIWDFSLFSPSYANIAGFKMTLPFALYPMLGFETCCAIGHTIEGGEKNVAKVVVSSFLIVATIYTLFQTSLWGALGPVLGQVATPLGAFATKLGTVLPALSITAAPFLNAAIMVSVIGAGYGILYANCWNVFAIAHAREEYAFARLLTKKNRFGVPTYSILLEAIIPATCLVFSVSIETLGRLTVLGMVITYLITAIGLLSAYKKEIGQKITLPYGIALLGLASCGYLGYYCIKDLVGL